MFSKNNNGDYSAIAQDKMEDIIECILQGKYSSACLVLLEATGHDPLHYIPYRTYNRLQKQRQQSVRRKGEMNRTTPTVTPLRVKMDDLEYVEPLEKPAAAAKEGGLAWAREASEWDVSVTEEAPLGRCPMGGNPFRENVPSWHVWPKVA